MLRDIKKEQSTQHSQIDYKMKKIFYLFAIIALGFYSCTDKDVINQVQIAQSANKNAQNFRIPLDSAIISLNTTIQQLDNNRLNSKGAAINIKRREIKNVVSLTRRNYNNNSRMKVVGNNATSISDTILYLVNFENDEGYAILAADKRIPSTVIAITESGSISAEDFNFKPDSIKGFKLYNDSVNDYYVGVTQPAAPKLVSDYAESSINNYNIPVYVVSDTWVTVAKVAPMLTTCWHQRSPFNDACPLVGSSTTNRSPAGCVATAIAQIMAYHEYPANLSCDGYLCNWAAMKDICKRTYSSNYGTTAARTAVAHLITNIGGWCGMIYSDGWSFAMPSSAKTCMSTFGYQNVSLDNQYNETKVLNMLNNNCPVFIAAISGLVDGHAWVIDGYIKQQRIVKMMDVNTTNVTSTITQTKNFVHCNWGWQGQQNGYYASGIFDLRNGATMLEDYYDDSTPRDLNFTWEFNIITYNKPNNSSIQ
jgi:hypothetical protein